MQRIFSVLCRIFCKSILAVVLIGLLVAAPAYAAPISTEGQKLIQQEQMDKESQIANQRAQEYEEQIKAAEDPDKVYEKNLKAYQEAHPDENIVNKAVEEAKELVDKVTDNK